MNHQTLDARSASLLLGAAACWGIATVITKQLLSALPPITLLIIQLAVSSVLLWMLVYLRGIHVADTKALVKLGATGLLNPGISYTLSLLGLTTTTVAMSTLLWASEPVLILGLAWLTLREPLTLRQIVFSLTAMAGVVAIGGLGIGAMTDGIVLGNALIFGGVLCCAVYTVIVQRVGSDVNPLLTVALQQTVALLWALLIWPLELRSGAQTPIAFGLSTWFWAGFSGVIYYALAFWLYVHGLKRASASLAGAFINLVPIFGISGAYLFLGERLSPLQWVGALVILLSVFMLLRGRDRNVAEQIAMPSPKQQ